MASLRELDAASQATFERSMSGRPGARRLHVAVFMLCRWMEGSGQHRIDTGWSETHKLRVQGDANRDRLVAARLNLGR